MKRIFCILIALLLALACGACAESAPADGLYTVGVSSNASMFKVVDCLLRVEDGRMVAVMTMSGSGYGYLYQGTSAEADAAPVETWTPFTEDSEGRHVFAIEIPALDEDVAMASWSIKYEKWYDRTLQFFSSTLTDYDLIAPDGVYSGVLRSDTGLDGTACTLRSAGGEMTVEADGLTMALPSLDKKVPVDGGWLILDSDSLEESVVRVDDGVYSVEVDTDSNLMKFVDCVMTVKNGRMVAVLTAKNDNFAYLYLGLAKDAPNDEDAWIPAAVDADGRAVYVLTVPTLDNAIPVATYSAKKKLWYDRTMTFGSESLTALNK